MSKALKRAVKTVFDEARETKSAMRRLLNPPNDNSFAGSRAFPPQHKKKDETFGIRFDRGMSVKDNPSLVMLNLQINSNAKEKTLRDLVKKYGSHRKYVSIPVDTTQKVDEKNLENLHSEINDEIDGLGDL